MPVMLDKFLSGFRRLGTKKAWQGAFGKKSRSVQVDSKRGGFLKAWLHKFSFRKEQKNISLHALEIEMSEISSITPTKSERRTSRSDTCSTEISLSLPSQSESRLDTMGEDLTVLEEKEDQTSDMSSLKDSTIHSISSQTSEIDVEDSILENEEDKVEMSIDEEEEVDYMEIEEEEEDEDMGPGMGDEEEEDLSSPQVSRPHPRPVVWRDPTLEWMEGVVLSPKEIQAWNKHGYENDFELMVAFQRAGLNPGYLKDTFIHKAGPLIQKQEGATGRERQISFFQKLAPWNEAGFAFSEIETYMEYGIDPSVMNPKDLKEIETLFGGKQLKKNKALQDWLISQQDKENMSSGDLLKKAQLNFALKS